MMGWHMMNNRDCSKCLCNTCAKNVRNNDRGICLGCFGCIAVISEEYDCPNPSGYRKIDDKK